MEKKSTEANKIVALASANPANIFSEVLVRHADKTDRSLPSHDELPAREALLSQFAKDREWQSFFRSCCEMSTYRIVLLPKRVSFATIYAQEAWDKQVVTAGRDINPVAFRRALKGWERSGIEAVERVRVKEGGAA